MNLKMTNKAHKSLGNLDAKQFRQVVLAILNLTQNPHPHDSIKLHGATNGERRQDVGEYRIVYSHDVDTVEILLVGKRNDDEVYRRLRR